MKRAAPGAGRRVRAYAYTFVTTAIVLLFALAEWATERYVSDRSRAAGIAIQIVIVLIAALVFTPIHKRVEAAVDAVFYKRKRQALLALEKFRRELNSFNDIGQLLRRVIEAVEHYLEATACAVYLRRDVFHAEASSFDTPAQDVELSDPLAVRLRSSGAPARPPLLESGACGTHAFPLMAGGDLIGFLSVHCKNDDFDPDETKMLTGLAGDLAAALVTLDPLLRPRKPETAHNIPADLPPVIGRERELSEITAALEHSKLVTLTGPGGVGKTRIALECAARALARHEHGAWFVNLAPIANGALVAGTMLSALDGGAAGAEGDLSRLLDHLRSRDALVVIDNCEQVIADVATIVAQIRAACPRITILATSRELLHLDGEQVYRLGSLRPEAAVELFGNRAAAVSAGFNVREHAEPVRSICERLDCIPLAIELAAARVRSLSVDEILERLHERFRLLTGGARTALPRQSTLAATIEWSYDLLTQEEQSLFRRLGVFRGSFSLAAAAAVCADGGKCDEFHVLDVLTSLADKSVLTVTLALVTRYRFLETIREFALQQTVEKKETGIASNQHAAYFGAAAAQAYHEFDSHLPPRWLDMLSPDVDNYRAALEWTLEGLGDRRAGAQLAADCGPMFLRLELLGEGLRWCESARGVTGLPPGTAGRIEYVASMLHNNTGESRRALACAERAVTFYGQSSDERALIRALAQVAQLYARAKRFDDAKAPAEEAIRRARALGEPRMLIGVLRRCAFSLPPSEIDKARQWYSEALALARSVHDSEESCRVLSWWAYREAGSGSLERAIELGTEGLQCADRDSQMYLENQVVTWTLALGRLDEAAPHARKALALAAEAGHEQLIALAIAYCAAAHAKQNPNEAAELLGYAKARLQEFEWEPQADDELALRNVSAVIASTVGDGELTSLLQRGAAWSQREALGVLLATSAGGREAQSPALDAGDGVHALLI